MECRDTEFILKNEQETLMSDTKTIFNSSIHENIHSEKFNHIEYQENNINRNNPLSLQNAGTEREKEDMVVYNKPTAVSHAKKPVKMI